MSIYARAVTEATTRYPFPPDQDPGPDSPNLTQRAAFADGAQWAERKLRERAASGNPLADLPRTTPV